MLSLFGCVSARPLTAESRPGGIALTTRSLKLAAIATALATLIAATPANARPIDDKRARAVAVKAQMQTLDHKLEAATEEYNEANLKYQAVTAKVNESQAKLGRIRKRIKTLQSHLSVRSIDMYRSGPTQMIEMLLGAVDFEQLANTWDLLKNMSRSDADAAAQLKVAKKEVLAVRAQLRSQQIEAEKQRDVMQSRKSAIEGDLAKRRGMLRGIEREIAALESAENARRRAAENQFRSNWGGNWGTPTNAPRGQVVQIAMRYLGRPYVWAAAGPNSFDCSGFTMFVYRQVGVSLPHSSRMQINYGQRVSRANLKPGDLVFFGSPIHHVGIYVGNGQMIHAPHTGAVVRIDPLHSNFAGASRP